MSNPLPVPPSNDTPGGLIKSTDVSTLYNLLAGATTNSISIDGAITASDVITANGGLTVPSGQTATVSGTLDVTGTATVAGTLDVTGTATVPNATAPTQPVALGQVTQTPPVMAGGSTAAGVDINLSVTPATAPCAGYFIVITNAGTSNGFPSGNYITLTSTITGLFVAIGFQTGSMTGTVMGYQPVSAGQGPTFNATVASNNSSSQTNAVMMAFFVPTP